MTEIPDGWERGEHQWGLVELNLDDDTIIQCWKDGTVTLMQTDDSIEIKPHVVDKLIKRLQETKKFAPYKNI